MLNKHGIPTPPHTLCNTAPEKQICDDKPSKKAKTEEVRPKDKELGLQLCSVAPLKKTSLASKQPTGRTS
jgi:hypothetical protein